MEMQARLHQSSGAWCLSPGTLEAISTFEAYGIEVQDAKLGSIEIMEGVVQLRGSWNSLLSWLREASTWGRAAAAASQTSPAH